LGEEDDRELGGQKRIGGKGGKQAGEKNPQCSIQTNTKVGEKRSPYFVPKVK